jgi:hypothetical protein
VPFHPPGADRVATEVFDRRCRHVGHVRIRSVARLYR